MHLPFWLTTALLFPVLLYQGKRAHRTTPRLPEAGGSPSGPEDFNYVNYPLITDPELLASDGYHPGRRGYGYIA